MLPAIYFIFSRRGCREALQRCAYHSLDLTTDAQKAAIDAVAADRLRSLKDAGEMALYNKMVDGGMLRRGLAVHHAGLLPFHKELVEELFTQGLIKVVFATETLSLGINMPARAVVVSSFTKFDGVNFSNLTTGELTQLMGRAGRRGIDTLGHGIISKEADVEIGTIYEVAMGEGLVVESKFLPNYNMVLNLLRIHPAAEAEKLMQRSFGQYQKQLAATQTRERLINVRERLRDLEKVWECDHGCKISDLAEYYRIEDRRRVIRIELRRLRREAFPAGPPKGRTSGRGKGRGRRPQPQGPVGQRDQPPRRGGARAARQAAPAEDRPLPALRRPRRRLRRDPPPADRAGERREGGRRPVRRVRPEVPAAAPGADRDLLPEGRPAHRARPAGLAGLRREHARRHRGDRPRALRGPDPGGALRGPRDAHRRGPDARPRPRPTRRYPTPGVAQVGRLVRSLYFRFSDLERELDEPNLRPPSHDYIDFAYRWASGEGLDTIPLPPNADIGDAIKSMKGLYSLLRQLEWALKEQRWPLADIGAPGDREDGTRRHQADVGRALGARHGPPSSIPGTSPLLARRGWRWPVAGLVLEPDDKPDPARLAVTLKRSGCILELLQGPASSRRPA